MSLILKLDESVNDNSLPKLGELFIDVDISHNFSVGFLNNNSEEFTARIIGTGNFFTDASYSTSAGDTVTQTTAALFCSSGTYTIGITPKYDVRSIGVDLPNLSDLNALSLDCSQLKYAKYGFSILASHWKLTNVTGENISKCTELSVIGATLELDVDELSQLTNMTSCNISSTDSYGDAVAAFGNKLGLTRLVYVNTQCTGTYSAVCDAMYANGRTSGSMVIGDSAGSGLKTVTFTAGGWSST